MSIPAVFTSSPPPRVDPAPPGPGQHRPPGAPPGLQAAPFDALRQQYAYAVVLGLLPRSTITSGRLERLLHTLEGLLLGPLARKR